MGRGEGGPRGGRVEGRQKVVRRGSKQGWDLSLMMAGAKLRREGDQCGVAEGGAGLERGGAAAAPQAVRGRGLGSPGSGAVLLRAIWYTVRFFSTLGTGATCCSYSVGKGGG